MNVDGVEQIRDSDLKPLLVFIMPPSTYELERRLIGGKNATPERTRERLARAYREMAYGKHKKQHKLPL